VPEIVFAAVQLRGAAIFGWRIRVRKRISSMPSGEGNVAAYRLKQRLSIPVQQHLCVERAAAVDGELRCGRGITGAAMCHTGNEGQ